MNRADKTTPHADHKGLLNILGSTGQVAPEIIAEGTFLDQLKQIGQGDKLRQFDGFFSVDRGERKGEQINTTGKVIIPLLDSDLNPASVAIFTPNSEQTPDLTEPSQPHALFIGDPFTAKELWVTDDKHKGIGLYIELAITQKLKVAIGVSPNPFMFDHTVKAFAEKHKVTITATLEQKAKLVKTFKGHNVKAVLTETVPLHNIMGFDDATYQSVMASAQVIDLEPLDWIEPESLTIDPSEPTAYPIDAWQGLLKSVIEKIAYYAQVPLAMAGQCVLGALSHMGQRFIDAPMGHRHMPASLYLITEGESGSGKSVAMGLSHQAIREYERKQYEIYLQSLEQWEADKAALSGKELKEFLANEPKPHNPITMFGDATIEPILDKFVNGEMDNASWTTDEAGQFFNGPTMKGDTAGNALSALTTLYSDGVVNRLRSQKSQHANPRSQAYDVRMTLLLMGQRIVLEKALTDPLMTGQGFLARAMLACPDSLQGQRVWDDSKRRQQSPYDDTQLIAYWQKCSGMLDPSPINDPSINNKGRIKMRWQDGQAEQAFYEGMQAIENRQAKGYALEYLKAYASRMAENASRIASLMAYFDGRYTITTDDIKRAFMLVEYSTSERLRYLDASPSNDENNTQKLSKWLIEKAKDKNPHKLNRTYLSNSAPSPMRKDSKLLQVELDKLESIGHIRQDKEGRKSVVIVNPRLYA